MAWPCLVSAGTLLAQSKEPVRIGWLAWGASSEGTRQRDLFKQELAAMGWRAGSQVVFEERFADGRADRLPGLATELAAKKLSLIVATPVPPAQAAVKAAPKTPILVIGGDPVAAGLAASHARPGGMVTGLTNLSTEISEKYLELLLAAAPKLRRIGFLLNSSSGGFSQHKENARRSAEQYAVEARFVESARAEDVGAALASLETDGVQGIVVMSSAGAIEAERRRILEFALARRWPSIGGTSWADAGALLSYSADFSALFRRAAHLADRILKGTKPSDLPIERPTNFELVLNMKTAKALGLAVPQELGVRVNRVIQ
jgi:putative ABC transport system substrate-binding protein